MEEEVVGIGVEVGMGVEIRLRFFFKDSFVDGFMILYEEKG